MSVNRDLYFYNYDELLGLLMTGLKADESVIVERRKGYAVLREGRQTHFFSKADADALWKEIKRLTLPEDRRRIFGSTAFGGVVRGRVRVAFQSFNKRLVEGGYGVKKGEILVTDMTKPDMFVACKKAAGIVTDEGGIICHASIIARELKKPCIVGTKNATQILKNGDLVEVDADKGVVRIIKKA